MKLITTLCLIFMLSCLSANGQPVITSTSSWEHGQSVVISGNSFGNKSPAPPLWWDNGEGQVINNHGHLSSRYNDSWPYIVTEDGGNSNIQYRTTGHRNVTSPHQRSQIFITGCHDDQGECLGGEVGQNVGLTISDGTRHTNWYVSFYLRLDPQWPQSTSQNYKYFNWETNPPYRMYSSPFCYENVNPCAGGYNNLRRGPGCKDSWWTSQILQQFNYNPSYPDGYPLITHDTNVNNPALGWLKEEHIIDTTNTSDVFYQTLIDNIALVDTERMPEPVVGSSRMANPFGGVTIGGFWKGGVCGDGQDDLDDNACRYFDDVYVDITFARVVLTNAPIYSESSIIELQPPITWSGNSITVIVNQGALGTIAYLYIFNEDNVRSTGYLITFGEQSELDSPTNLRVVQ